MTVKDLIGVLEKMPQDAVVIYASHSEYTPMDPDEVTLHTPETKTMTVRHGNYRRYYDYHDKLYPQGESPIFTTAVAFPGN